MDIHPVTIDGHYVDFEEKKDTSMLWSLVGNKRLHVSVSATYWNFSTDSLPVYSARYSNPGNSHSGYVYGEIFPFFPAGKGVYYIKNIVGKFCTVLQKGITYELSFWIKPFYGNYYIDKLDVHFDAEKMPFTGYVRRDKKTVKDEPEAVKQLYQPIKLSIDCSINRLFDNAGDYIQVKCRYVAKGEEKYVYIGYILLIVSLQMNRLA